jgi:hypothetical protein
MERYGRAKAAEVLPLQDEPGFDATERTYRYWGEAGPFADTRSTYRSRSWRSVSPMIVSFFGLILITLSQPYFFQH